MSKVEIFEKERASNYNQFVEDWIPNYSYFMEKLPKLLSETDNKDLLVVGCGTGNEIVQFAKADQDWKITGVDPSPEMINQAKERLAKHENIELIEGLVSDLSQDRKYGAVTLLLVLHFLEDNGQKLDLLRQIAQRLKTEAPLVMLDITGDQKQMKTNLKVLKQLLPNNLDKDLLQNRLQRIENDLHYVPEERLMELCQEAGFERPVRFFQTSIYMGWITWKK
ncbi:MAG: methyltransferase domain-containing protein [Roseivirga sp.]|jgi:tRNA (cmo5U34)-methyltransferase|uniref:class I SAM-dependent methyltransferase n=1 Tax=Roseivirga sp. TaxID=1964215 RepID=UPI001B171AC3|nr:class I SAM-dependent methyltransferase [Roseivirga sp.]MBO6496160.1 methyltransferase domain-containing protein [Roseivirga sp.]